MCDVICFIVTTQLHLCLVKKLFPAKSASTYIEILTHNDAHSGW